MSRPRIPHRFIPEPWRHGITWRVTFCVNHNGYVERLETECHVRRSHERPAGHGRASVQVGPFDDVLEEVRESMLLAAIEASAEQLRLFP